MQTVTTTTRMYVHVHVCVGVYREAIKTKRNNENIETGSDWCQWRLMEQKGAHGKGNKGNVAWGLGLPTNWMLEGEEGREGVGEAFFDCPRAHTRFICFWLLTHKHTDTHAAQLQAKSAKNHTPIGQKEIATATVETNGQSWTDR